MMLMFMLKPTDRVRYNTQRAYGPHPAGTSCFASRPEGLKFVRLEFDNGDVVEAQGHVGGVECYVADEYSLAY